MTWLNQIVNLTLCKQAPTFSFFFFNVKLPLFDFVAAGPYNWFHETNNKNLFKEKKENGKSNGKWGRSMHLWNRRKAKSLIRHAISSFNDAAAPRLPLRFVTCLSQSYVNFHDFKIFFIKPSRLYFPFYFLCQNWSLDIIWGANMWWDS